MHNQLIQLNLHINKELCQELHTQLNQYIEHQWLNLHIHNKWHKHQLQ
jgi:hypothetical protein